MSVPSDFDWVKARSECSPATVYEQIRLEVERDVATRNAQLPPDTHYTFKITAIHESFVVSVVSAKGKHVPLRSVTFSLEGAGISVHDNVNKLNIEGTLTLSDDRECRLKVKSKELEFWQFRRMALEWLLFGNLGRSW